jgi:hypothetical protein
MFEWWRQQLKTIRRRCRLHKVMRDLSTEDRDIIERVLPFTMLSPDRLYAFMQATRHVVRTNVPGGIVECGVWKGGAVMASLLTMRQMNRADRDYFLYDTFAGMPAPTAADKQYDGEALAAAFAKRQLSEDTSSWCRGEFSEVERNIRSAGYEASRIQFVKGRVEETIPRVMPEQIAVLRLDTDWYASTRHELEHLYPRLSAGGVLIVDDYGHWRGARQAVDEYFESHKIPMLLHRTDYTGRVGVKAA